MEILVFKFKRRPISNNKENKKNVLPPPWDTPGKNNSLTNMEICLSGIV